MFSTFSENVSLTLSSSTLFLVAVRSASLWTNKVYWLTAMKKLVAFGRTHNAMQTDSKNSGHKFGQMHQYFFTTDITIGELDHTIIQPL